MPRRSILPLGHLWSQDPTHNPLEVFVSSTLNRKYRMDLSEKAKIQAWFGTEFSFTLSIHEKTTAAEKGNWEDFITSHHKQSPNLRPCVSSRNARIKNDEISEDFGPRSIHACIDLSERERNGMATCSGLWICFWILLLFADPRIRKCLISCNQLRHKTRQLSNRGPGEAIDSNGLEYSDNSQERVLHDSSSDGLPYLDSYFPAQLLLLSVGPSILIQHSAVVIQKDGILLFQSTYFDSITIAY